MNSSYYFCIVGHNDRLLYELEHGSFGAKSAEGSKTSSELRHLNQFIVHSSLDVVEDSIWNINTFYLKVIDKFNDWLISAFVTAGGIKFMMLHDARNEDGIKNFCQEIYEMYIKILLNPFYSVDSPITLVSFDQKVKALGRKYLT